MLFCCKGVETFGRGNLITTLRRKAAIRYPTFWENETPSLAGATHLAGRCVGFEAATGGPSEDVQVYGAQHFFGPLGYKFKNPASCSNLI